ncbi:hypothetical protein DVH05_005212 [Phytophthora capsici]|nr:hypothetical protein DVH05_005212 [Phytophthora capsici]
MPAQLILLFPEVVPQGTRTSIAAPPYAEGCDDSEPEKVRVRTLAVSEEEAQPTVDTWLPRSSAFRRLVWASEAGVWWCRQSPLVGGGTPRNRQFIWRCPRTGSDVVCSIEHVIYYVYYRNGGKAPPASVRLGETFCHDPASSPTEGNERQVIPSRARTNSGTIDQIPLADLLDTLDRVAGLSIPGPDRYERQEGVDYGNTTENDSLRQVSPDVTPRNGGAASAPVRILSVLANNPDLLETYASQLPQLGPERKRPRVQAISDSVLMTPRYEDGGDRRHNFRPSQGQQAVHDAITAVEHRGKSPALFVEHVRSSHAMKFLPHPAVLSRLYDFEFGVCGLSISHLRRFNLNAKLDHARSNAVHLSNFSVKVSLPSLPVNPNHESLCDSLNILGTYAEEFFEAPTRRLITTAKAFSEELNDYAPSHLKK